jgi:protein phosphatase
VPIWVDGAIHKACHLDDKSRYEALSEFLFDLEHPNPTFLETVQTAEEPEFVLKKYKVLVAVSFAINIFLLLLLVR